MSHYIVTGANRGLGLELARQLAARGEVVTATARRPADARELSALGVRVEPLDVSDPQSVAAFRRALGDEPVDVLINNAGIGVKSRALDELDPEELALFFDVNSVGALRVTQALLPNLRAGARKCVVGMSSKMGSIEDNTSGGSYAYRASKAALNAITKSLALDLAPQGFTCVVMHPGWVRTDMGGREAPLAVEESVRGMLAVIDGLDPSDAGRFFDFAGEAVPW